MTKKTVRKRNLVLKKAINLLIVSLLFLGVTPIGTYQTIHTVQAEVYNTAPIDDDNGCAVVTTEKEVSSTSTQDKTSSLGAGDTDWTKEGTTAYKNAKKAFDTFTSVGLSGEASAGIIGWVNSEGGWYIVDRAEGHFGNDPSTASISRGVTPNGFVGYSVGGGGIYQFTPYTKFAPVGDSKWADASAQTAFVLDSIKKGDWVASMDMSGKNQSFEQFARNTNITETALGWQAYERGNPAYIPKEAKIADAKKANEVFNSKKIPFNEKKFNEFFGGKAQANDSSKNNDNSKSGTTDDGCAPEEDSSSTDSGGTGTWSKDKSGKVNYRQFQAWKAKDLPADLKPYAVNPESVGMKMNDTSTWKVKAYSFGQCTDFSASFMYALWEKDGQHPTMKSGNGDAVAGNWAISYGGKISHTPSAGAVFSTGGGAYGHTGVVSHVFENGDTLIIEQNFLGFSGDFSNLPVTWNYRYVTKSQIESEGWRYYSPSQSGYKIVKEAKSQ